MNEQRLYKILIAALVVIVCSFAVSGFTVYKTYALHNKFDAKTQENNVQIAGEYTILSTEDLSKAYRNGNTSKLSVDDKQTIDNAKKVIKEVITDDMSDFEKEKAIYDWMVTNINHDEGALTVIPNTTQSCDKPSGVLKTHTAVCVGYATTFRLFMEMLNIPCHVVHNTDEYHSWNVVQLDGDWYIVDTYTDAGTTSYAYFNINDDIMTSTGNQWDHDAFPECNSLKYNLSYQNMVNESDVYNAVNDFAKELKAGHNQFSIQFDHTLSENEVNILSYIQNSIETNINMKDETTVSYFNSSTYASEQGTLFLYSLASYASDYNDEEETGVSEKTEEKITKAIDKAFGDLSTINNDYLYGDAY